VVNRSILIADDDRLLRESLCDVLADLGFKTRQVGTGASAIGVIKEHRFDLMISDVDMPDMTGFALLEWVTCHAPMPAVLMSARADSDLGRAARESGAIVLLPKPVQVANITSVIHQLFERR
jgi:DNA-binding NtrC family response regulator